MFLVKIANKGTSFKCIKIVLLGPFVCTVKYKIFVPFGTPSLHTVSKTRLSIPHLLGSGEQFLSVFCREEEDFLTLALQENYISPNNRKNDTSLS